MRSDHKSQYDSLERTIGKDKKLDPFAEVFKAAREMVKKDLGIPEDIGYEEDNKVPVYEIYNSGGDKIKNQLI